MEPTETTDVETTDLGFRDKLRRIVLFIAGIVVFTIFLYVVWRVLHDFISPGDDPTERKDLVQAFAVIVGGVVAFGTLLVGWWNLRNNQKTLQVQQENTQGTLEQQRRIEEHRAQDTALQEYLKRMGELLLDRVCAPRRTQQKTTA